MPVSREALFAWHEREGAFFRLVPPWERIALLRKDPTIRPGSEVHFKIYSGPFYLTWVSRHTTYNPPREFIDEGMKGPFKRWIHYHRMHSISNEASEMEDELIFDTFFPVKKQIERLFNYRHTLLRHDLSVQKALPSKSLKIGITGATGLVGSALLAFLQTAGHSVTPLSRPYQKEAFEGLDALYHLAGENIGSLWTKSKKKRIYESRVLGTKGLVDLLHSLENPPKVFLSASAIGFHQEGFLQSVCKDWEKEALLYQRGRVVIPRFGVVLSASKGALKKIQLPFSLGLGGKLGSGKQMMSWIALDDLVYSLYRIFIDESFAGPIDVCSPHPVSNEEFTKILGKIFRRPTFFSIPAFLLKCFGGEMAKETLLSDLRVAPKALIEKNHTFFFPEIESALRHTLGK